MKPDQTIDQLWETYYPKVYGYFYRRLNNLQDIEDLTSIVLTQFLTKLVDETIEIKKPNAFLWKVAYFHLVDFIDHKTKRPLPISIDDDFEAPTEIENKLQSDELNSKLEKIIVFAQNSLTNEDYTIFSRSYIDGDRIMDIAHDLDLKANTATVKLKRIISKLKEQTLQI
jgi:RNA polymerase sigma factor (sigma-70 family)